jgi:hypothetical protein
VQLDREEELTRQPASLVRSREEAGILINPNAIGGAIFRVHLPPAGWSFAIDSLGLSLFAVIFAMLAFARVRWDVVGGG